MKCGACGAQMPGDARFCETCGAPAAGKAHCINCGAELRPEDTFCGDCGASQKGAPAAPRQEPLPPPELPAKPVRPASKSRGGLNSIMAVVGALAVVLAVVAGAAYLTGAIGGRSSTPTPGPAAQASGGQQPISLGAPQSKSEPAPTAAPTRPAPPTATMGPSPTKAPPTMAPAQIAATAQAVATATAVAQMAAQATATAKPAFDAAATLAKNTTRVKTVLRGNLEPRDDGRPASQGWEVDMRDFAVEGRFFNPWDRKERAWDYGILFRAVDERDGYRLTVHSDAEWHLELAIPSGDQAEVETIAKGHVGKLELGADGTNVLRLVCGEKAAYFFVNGGYVATLDVSKRTDSGDVAVVTGVFPHHTIAGRATRFEGFDLFSLE